MVSLISQKNNQVIVNNTTMAGSWIKRLIGLLTYSDLKPGEGLWLSQCQSIHTIGMRFSIDVLFLDQAMQVTKVAHNVKPFRVCWAGKPSVSVLELPAGTLKGLNLMIGDKLVAKPGRVTDETQSNSYD